MTHEARSKMARGIAIFGPDGRSNSGLPSRLLHEAAWLVVELIGLRAFR